MARGRWLGYCPDMPGIVIVGAGFGGTDALPPADQLNRIADAAVDTFLAAYG